MRTVAIVGRSRAKWSWLDEHHVAISYSKINDVAQSGNSRGSCHLILLGGSITNATKNGIAPSLHRSIRKKSSNSFATNRHLGDASQPRDEGGHFCGRGFVVSMTRVSSTPRPHGPSGGESKGMVTSGIDVGDALSRQDCSWEVVLDIACGTNAGTKLCLIVLSSRIDITDAVEIEGGITRGGNVNDSSNKVGELDRLNIRELGSRAKTELEVVIVTSAPDLTICCQVQSVRQTRCRLSQSCGHVGTNDGHRSHNVSSSSINWTQTVSIPAVVVVSIGCTKSTSSQTIC